ncbi:hypothetical protein HMPREF0298_1715 [Corynebacterium lipophiloflavum DSM 44291]|uniref:Uncharacterized protein n=1 Tax=Corynebacterium lipophiloflavum (strain ATCC 700352 / DSM 44291 / CCUG 37336 / JCM 10383 / DMMZ 1944) TaxID=525263 RepID=C0XTE5_CORLD|nr:hypothetical protein HMPREF0298_1715 [Corynebacterium lipophiloflavum DSM 44291]
MAVFWGITVTAGQSTGGRSKHGVFGTLLTLSFILLLGNITPVAFFGGDALSSVAAVAHELRAIRGKNYGTVPGLAWELRTMVRSSASAYSRATPRRTT